MGINLLYLSIVSKQIRHSEIILQILHTNNKFLHTLAFALVSSLTTVLFSHVISGDIAHGGLMIAPGQLQLPFNLALKPGAGTDFYYKRVVL